ncbi:HlyD family secretion protein [Vitreimonas flagellata]|uniref:HlyD family secretion protein n=1 Tax=Vitreimonas flagellata TaxID=2560861 RepID=UPI001074BBE6|nr:HlyD family secretion protein [Vitreimonas flagellata]
MDAQAPADAEEAAPNLIARLRARMTGRTRLLVIYGVPAAGLVVLLFMMVTGGRFQETENAYVQAARVPISTSITGRIVDMRVIENQQVHAGQVLFRLDRANPAADVAQYEAALASARARALTLRAEFHSQQANLRARRESVGFAQAELRRTRALGQEGIRSQQDVEAAQHALEQAQAERLAAEQALGAALANLGGDPNIDVDQHPAVREAAARLERARLALSYTEVIAPQDGVVTRVDQVQVGTFVNAGQTLFWLVAGEPWIEANFKENQIGRMQIGQRARVRIDTFGGREYEARVVSFSPGTGAVFSPLPAQNATGNWVKVVQRVPVRLTLVDPPADLVLRAGLSAHARVDTRSIPDRLRGR